MLLLYKSKVMENKFTWLHLADLHLRNSTSWDSNFVLKNMISDIHLLQLDNNIQIDAIFITGDLTYSGQIEEFDLFNQFLAELIHVTKVPIERCYCVPGNHDLDRSVIDKEATAFRKNLLSDTTSSQLEKVQSDENTMKHLIAPLDNFSRYVVLPTKINHEKIFYTEKLILPELPIDISILGLNSAWLSYDDGPPIVGRRQVQEAIEEIDRKSYIIGLIHHPLTLLLEWDQESVFDITDFHLDILLRGHCHRSRLENLGQSPYRCSHIATGSSYSGGESLNRYMVVETDFEQGISTAFLRICRPDRGSLWIEDNIFRIPLPGQHRWDLSARLAKQLIPHKHEVHIKDLEFLNRDYIHQEEKGFFEIVEQGQENYNKVKNLTHEFKASFDRHSEKVSKGLNNIRRAPNIKTKMIIYDQIAVSMNILANEIVEKIPQYRECSFKAVDRTCKAAKMIEKLKSEEKNDSLYKTLENFASLKSTYVDLSRKIAALGAVLQKQIAFTPRYGHSKNQLLNSLSKLLEEFSSSKDLIAEAEFFIGSLLKESTYF